MKWAHLPEAGGLMQQKPGLLDSFYYIFGAQSEFDKQENAKREREMGKANPTAARRAGAARSRR